MLVAKVLLKVTVHTKAQGRVYRKALQAASVNGYVNVENMLLTQGADSNPQDGRCDYDLSGMSYRGGGGVTTLSTKRV